MRVYLIRFLALLSIAICLSLVFGDMAKAATSTDKNYLTIEILQEKLENTVRREGTDIIELNNYIIDLTRQDSEFEEQFYREIYLKISRIEPPVALDFSDSVVQGDFDLSRLGIATPLVEGALSSLLKHEEREKIKDYHQLIKQPTAQNPKTKVFRGGLKLDRAVFTATANFSDLVFLQPLTASASNFQQQANFNNSIFGREIDFSEATFDDDLQFKNAHLFDRANFKDLKTQGIADFSGSYFEEQINFNNAVFFELVDFTKSIFTGVADFSKTMWRDRVLFSKSKFLDTLILANATFEKNLAFRDVYVGSQINLRDANLLGRLDFSNAFFTVGIKIDLSGLALDSEEAKVIGESGKIGKVIKVDSYEGNETVFRNLIYNFRNLDQFNDANQIEYQRERQRFEQLGTRLAKTPWRRIFSFDWVSKILRWLGLSVLLFIGDYGTNLNLIFGLGIITIAFFSLLFWFIDRYRPQVCPPIIPTRYETVCMLGSYLVATFLGMANTFIATDNPWFTLACVTIVLVPMPLILAICLYRFQQTDKLHKVSYFVENGEMRQFRLMLGRLPIMPRFYFFRDRYLPILWDKRWNWLNYYDLSLNNVFKLGFNDIRVRDEHLPSIIAILVWYQWCLGGLYTILLLWTISRTIPALNLLLYF